MDALPVVPHVLGLILAAAIGALKARHLRRIRPDVDAENAIRQLPHLWVLCAVALVTCVGVYRLITLPIGVQARFPLGLVDGAPIVLWGTVLALFAYIFSLTLTLAFATRHETRWALTLGAVLSIAAVEVTHARVTTPVWPQLEATVDSDGAILQSSGSTCAAASGANIARTFGMDYTEIDVARAMHSTEFGTTTAQIVRGMAALGLVCTPFALDPAEPETIPAPAIAFVPLADGTEDGHAIAVLSVTTDLITVVDPLSGMLQRAPGDMIGHWGGRGVACSRAPGS